MRRTSHILLVTIFCSLQLPLLQAVVFAQSVDNLATCIVYLQVAKTKTVQIDGALHELWIKKPADSAPKPYTDTFCGTGFFVVRDNTPYLVTADHIAQLMDATAMITIQTSGDRPLRFSLVDFLISKTAVKWNSSQEADVSVLQLSPSQQMFQNLKKHFLPFEILTATDQAPLREKTLTVVGFPLGLGVTERFSPISQESKPSSGLLRLARFDNNKIATFFLLDKPSVGGFSGAPVFEFPGAYSSGGGLTLGGKFACVGLMHGTISDETGGKFAAVVPSSFIVKTILQMQK